MKKILLCAILLMCFLKGYSQFYPFDSIPDNLKKGADAVIRTSQGLFTISAPGKAVQRIREVVTLLNNQAEDYRYLAVYYDKSSKINYIRGTVYDEKGSVVKSLGNMDIFDMSAITGGSFYTDDRMKAMRFPLYKYPYTIEYEYEIEFSSILTYPLWEFHEDDNVSVEKSGIQFVLPAGMRMKYYEDNLKNTVDSVILDDRKIYTWEERNIPATRNLWKSLGYISLKPVLDVAPYEFEYGGITGSMTSWRSFGEWIFAINRDRDILPDDEVATITSLVSKQNERRDKIKAVYEYMQSRTRYVSIQIGIGGNQTALASDVVKNGYGDCKALTNYTMALLKAAGINSYMTLVKAGVEASDIKTSFVDNQFNHVILCVPDENDTIWLECTSQTLPFNFLGSFTCDRHALMITPEGGKLVKTPEYKKEENIVVRSGSMFFNMAGTSSSRLETSYSGYYFDNASSMFSLQSEDEMKKTLYSALGYPDFTVTSATYREERSENPKCEFSYQVSIRGFGATSGEQIYFTPSLSREEFLPDDTLRLRIMLSDISIDSISYWMPPEYKIESMPEEVLISCEFGNYNYSVKSSGEKILLYRRLELNKGLVPADKYAEFRDFYNHIARTDRSVIAISKN